MEWFFCIGTLPPLFRSAAPEELGLWFGGGGTFSFNFFPGFSGIFRDFPGAGAFYRVFLVCGVCSRA
jgi:hypothetical protein